MRKPSLAAVDDDSDGAEDGIAMPDRDAAPVKNGGGDDCSTDQGVAGAAGVGAAGAVVGDDRVARGGASKLGAGSADVGGVTLGREVMLRCIGTSSGMPSAGLVLCLRAACVSLCFFSMARMVRCTTSANELRSGSILRL